jgi:hypothetical protein
MSTVKQSRDKDPEILRTRFPEAGSARAGLRLALGLDLATSCGYCAQLFDPTRAFNPEKDLAPGRTFLGQLDLSAGPFDSGAIRFVRLRQCLAVFRPDVVFYEDIQPGHGKHSLAGGVHMAVARGAKAAELAGAYKATLACWCEEHAVPSTGFPLATVKKRATDLGNAGKPEVIRACNRVFGTDLDPDGYEQSGVDNIADAAWVCLLGLELYGQGFPGLTPVAGLGVLPGSAKAGKGGAA